MKCRTIRIFIVVLTARAWFAHRASTLLVETLGFGCVSFSTLKLVVDKGAPHLEALSTQLGWSGDLVSSDCIDL